jgi:glyoxylase-like metal-dependent hydrolase (beta-lactamase superfamily II)
VTEGANILETRSWNDNWLQVKVPLPFSLKWVNSYLLPGRDGYTLIDPGLHTPEAAVGWQTTLPRLGIAMGDIARIVLTHQHPDHYGLAGWFQERTGAPVWMSRVAHDYALRLWGPERSFSAELPSFYAKHGMPQELVQEIGPHLESFVPKVSPQPVVSYLPEAGLIEMGGMEWETIATSGHAEGHLCFYQRDRKFMLCGDQVLPDITPNVSFVPGEDGDPLRSFLDSLDLLAEYDVGLAFPGHRNPFTDFSGRISEIIGHHERRLAQIGGWLGEEKLTAYELCIRLFGNRLGGNIHNLRFAMSETLAHLVLLVREGKAVETASGQLTFYSA